MSTNQINKFIKRNKIEQLVLSKSLISNKTLADSFDVDNVNYDSKKITLFWGLYSFEEINRVKNHFGKKFILWGGNDCLPSKYEYLKDLKNILIHICLDRSTYDNLKSLFKKVYNLNEFNWNLYLETYPSLKKHIKTEELARLHYERIGMKEGKSIYGGTIDSDFDWNFYVNYYEDLKRIRNEYDAWKHYLIFGKAEKRLKNEKSLKESKDNSEDSKLFDWILYSRSYPSLKLNNKIQAYSHWIKYGKKEGRNLFGGNIDDSFDWKFYINKYQDLIYVKSEREAWIHYVKYGKLEGRKMNEHEYSRVENLIKAKEDNAKKLQKIEEDKKNRSNELREMRMFDWELYVNSYSDLSGFNKYQAWNHWIKLGKKEGRNFNGGEIGESFDWNFYINFYRDLNKIKSEREAWIHYLKNGKKEGRSANKVELENEIEKKNFDWILYNNSYNDLNFNNSKDAWVHWIKYGKKEGRNLKGGEIDKDFDWEVYVNTYKDLKKIKSEEEGWKHYIKYGKKENRIINHNVTYLGIKNDSNKNNKLWAHLHCKNIDQFNEMYQEYINEIVKYFSVIVTYSEGSFIPPYNFTILKIRNKGMDVGAKMCAIKFLLNENIVFDFILMLHSKSNALKREYYFKPIISQLDKIILNLNPKIGIYCAGSIYDGTQLILSNGKYSANMDYNKSWGRNEIWMNYLLDKLSLPKDNFVFPEGNNFILNSDVAKYMFDNRFDTYKYMNMIDSYDYSWVTNYYKLHQFSKNEVYQMYSSRNLYGNNLQLGKGWNGLADCMIEHAVERIPFSVCKLLNKEIEILNCSSNKIYSLNNYIKYNMPLESNKIIVIGCHTSSELKLLSLINNLKFMYKEYDMIFIVNSTEFKGDIERYIDEDEFIKDNYIINDSLSNEQIIKYLECNPDLNNLNKEKAYNHYKEFGFKEGRGIQGLRNLYISYEDNTKHLCHKKWYDCIKKNILDKLKYEIITLTNDSFLITNDLPVINNLKDRDCEILGFIDSYQIKYHIPDWFRIYSHIGIKKWMKYYEDNINNCNNFQDMINIMEVNSINAFEKYDTIFKMPSNYLENIHFDKKNRYNFYNTNNYQIVKLKALSTNQEYNLTELSKVTEKTFQEFSYDELLQDVITIIPDFTVEKYGTANSDLNGFDNNNLLLHFLRCGITEGRKYDINKKSNVPKDLKGIIPKNILNLFN